MGNLNRALLYLGLIFLSSCSIKYFRTDKGYARPVDNTVFTYKKRGFKLNTAIIDTTKIYCNAYPASNPEYFDCYRFFSTGQVLTYRFMGKIDTIAFANINNGGVAYYHIDKNIMRIQEFTVYAEHFKEGGGGALVHNYAIVKDSSIVMDHEHISKRYFAYRNFMESGYKLIYKKTQIIAPPLKPAW